MTDTAVVTETLLAPLAGDGRHHRSTTTKAGILAACRRLLMDGVYRPTMAECCELARRSERSGQQHFTIDELHTEALQDGVVREVIAAQVIGADVVLLSEATRDRVVRAVVLGRVR